MIKLYGHKKVIDNYHKANKLLNYSGVFYHGFIQSEQEKN